MIERELDLDPAPVFKRLWREQARYKRTWGGRGSGKSNDRAMAVIYLMISQPCMGIVGDRHRGEVRR
jgi:hypothetical protein